MVTLRGRKRRLLSKQKRTTLFVLTAAWLACAFWSPSLAFLQERTTTTTTTSTTNWHVSTTERTEKGPSQTIAKESMVLSSHLSRLRGGNISESFESQNRRRGMTAALSLANFSIMGAKCALPSVLSLLLDPQRGLSFSISNKTPQARFAGLLGMSTLSVALGKLLLGPVIDKIGGIRALQFTLALLTALLATISFSKSFGVFCVCWILVDFVFSSCWAACISSIQQSFPEENWGSQIGHLATGARMGNAVSFGLFSAILFALEGSWKQPWKVVFGVSAILQLVPLGLLLHFGGRTLASNRTEISHDSNKHQNPRFLDSLAILRTEARTPEFWLHLISRSCLMVFASFLLFVPTLMNQVYGCSNAVAAQVAAAYSLGCLVAVSCGSGLYSKFAKTSSKILSVSSLLGLAFGASGLQLASVSGWIHLPLVVSTSTMVVWGFAFALPFYLPPSLYALARGGREGSASIADCFDFVGFGFLAWFNRFVASIHDLSNPTSWIGCFQVTTVCALVAIVTQSTAIRLESLQQEPQDS